MTYYPTSEKLVSENYPYGYTLKTTKYDWLEYKKGKGFRHVSQTVNPKNGRLNAPKKGVYYKIMLLGKDENDHVSSAVCHINGTSEINFGAKFMFKHFNLFTPDQIRSIAADFLGMMKVDTVAAVQYCGAKFEDLKPFYEAAVRASVEIVNTAENLFDLISIDEECVKACHVPDYNPFKVTYLS